MPLHFADRLNNVETSAIRELFKLLGKPGIISFAGGFPDSAMFDVEGLREASQRALQEEPGQSGVDLVKRDLFDERHHIDHARGHGLEDEITQRLACRNPLAHDPARKYRSLRFNLHLRGCHRGFAEQHA